MKAMEDPSRETTILPNVRKIAVLRANGIGDFLFILPALDALRQTYPDAEIVLLGKQWHATFLAGRPGPVDRVVALPAIRGLTVETDDAEDTTMQEAFFERMQTERFDLAIQMHGGGRYSNPFLRQLGARVTAGLRTPDAEPLERYIQYVYWQPEILRFIEIVSLVGARPVGVEPCIAVLERDRLEAEALLPPSPEPVVAIHPGATGVDRRWPPEKFAVVGDALANRGARVVVVGGEEDRPLADAVVAAMVRPAENVAGRLSLSGLAGLFSRSALMVGNDSGPLHLASAVGTPSVGLYWCGNMINAGWPFRARHRPILSWRLNCPICGLDTTRTPCEHRVSFVADIPTDDVIAAATSLLML